MKSTQLFQDQFMNTAVYASIIEQLMDSTDSKSKCKLHWNQNCILYLEWGADESRNLEKVYIQKRWTFQKCSRKNKTRNKISPRANSWRQHISYVLFRSRKIDHKSYFRREKYCNIWGRKPMEEQSTNALAQDKSKKRKFKIAHTKKGKRSL